ncbi:MAG: haloacid dehalogenase-like hydrolase, partial [Ignavibacteria bacterium]
MKKIFYVFLPFLFTIIFIYCTEKQKQLNDPLPSWNDGKNKQAIVDFVKDITNESSPNFVKPEDRIATFDNDGTLWSEQPYYFQLQFAFDRVKAIAQDHPELKNNPLFKAAVENDVHALL